VHILGLLTCSSVMRRCTNHGSFKPASVVQLAYGVHHVTAYHTRIFIAFKSIFEFVGILDFMTYG